MLEISREDLLKDISIQRPDNATLFEELLFYVKDSKNDREITLLRFDNGFGAMVFIDSLVTKNTVYSVTWGPTASAINEFQVTHLPFGGPTNIQYSTFDEMRGLLRKIRDDDPVPAPF